MSTQIWFDACKAVLPKLTIDRQHKMAFITHYQWHEFLTGSRSTSPCLYKGFSGHSCQHIRSIYKQHGLLIQDCRDGLKSTKHWQYISHVAIFISIIIHCHFLSGCNEKGTCCKLVQWAKKGSSIGLYNEQDVASVC